MKILVVGVCASGKSTLVRRLKEYGFSAYHVTQEHSYVPYLWRRKEPDVVVYLGASLETIKKRRKIAWGDEMFKVQQLRLADVRCYADLLLDTDEMNEDEVLENVLEFLHMRKRNGGEKIEVE